MSNEKIYLQNQFDIKKCFIAYIDILGYKNMVVNGGEEIHKALMKAINDCIYLAKQLSVCSPFDIKVKAFSDNIFLCTENDYFMLFYLSCCLQAMLINMDIFSRGAICYGDIYWDENFVYGEGLIDVYEIESKKAKTPRIILDNTYITAAAKKEKQKLGISITFNMMLKHLKYYCVDFDGFRYLDYLMFMKDTKILYEIIGSNFETILLLHKIRICKRLEIESKEHLPKYEWCKSYHNTFCERNGYRDEIEHLIGSNYDGYLVNAYKATKGNDLFNHEIIPE